MFCWLKVSSTIWFNLILRQSILFCPSAMQKFFSQALVHKATIHQTTIHHVYQDLFASFPALLSYSVANNDQSVLLLNRYQYPFPPHWTGMSSSNALPHRISSTHPLVSNLSALALTQFASSQHSSFFPISTTNATTSKAGKQEAIR